MKRTFLFILSFAFAVASLWADVNTPLNFTAVGGPASVTLGAQGSPDPISLNYSTDNRQTWSLYTVGTEISLAEGETVYFKAESVNNTFSTGLNDNYHFGLSGSVEADGNIMSLLDASMQRLDVPDYAFCWLFAWNSSSLLTAPQLPATTLGDQCYCYLFAGCHSLESAPALPATVLADYCYQGMFYLCTSLAAAPALPATTLADYCYYNMFYLCKSLTIAPALPATTLADYCYKMMFCGCESLTAAPALPATTLADYCYYEMFGYCDSLTAAPALPATTLADYCYYDMFSGCTSLTAAPALPATELAAYCYSDMFYGCTSLAAAPALPATTLADHCYVGMFRECTSLVSIPYLPATELADYCYRSMFAGCSSLKVNNEQPGKSWQIPSGATEALMWNENMFGETGGTFTGNPQVGVTYYVESDPATAVEVVADNAGLTVAPNPARISEPVHFTVEDASTIELYDINCKCICRTSCTSSITAPAQSGIYIVKVTTSNGSITTSKLIVE